LFFLVLILDPGAHVTIFARRQNLLDEAKAEILAARKDESQEVKAVSVDLSDGAKVGLGILRLW
jgi:3-dehydrosphinganine reductase